MKRRDVNRLIASAPLLALTPTGSIFAQDGGAFQPAKQVTPRTFANKIDVVEFFWYGCPHCYHFEPALNKWMKTLPADVNFAKVPVGWPSKRVNFAGHQKLFYALEAMGKLDVLHGKVFDAMHKDKKQLADDAQIMAFVASVGLNPEQFANTFNSFSVSTKCMKANALISAFGIDSVPALGVDGRFYTSASLAGSEENALRVVDLLIKRQRQG